MSLPDKARRIRAVILDVDGVLTDGRIGYGPSAEEIKFFNVKDGLATRLLQQAGLRVGLLSGRQSAANRRRAEELGLDFVYEGREDKLSAFRQVLADHGLRPDECLYVGDDLADIPVLRQAGVGVAVADAAPEVKEHADWTTSAPGGQGAVREAVVWLLREQGKWDDTVRRYLG